MGVHIVDVDLSVNICRDQSSPIRTDGAVLNTESPRPHVESLTAHGPMTELGLQVERSRNKRFAISSPSSRCYGLPMMINSKKAMARLRSG